MNELKQKEINLFNDFKKGNHSAKVELLTSLQPVINSQVSKFATSGLPVIAIELEGKRLASDAIDSYDPNRSQLNTHVTNYLKKLSRFVTNYQNIGHIPEPRALMIGQYNNIYSNLEANLGREPSTIELADAMHVSIAEIDRLQSELRNDLSSSISSDNEDDEMGGFYEYVAPQQYDSKLREVLEFIYFDSDNTDRKIMEYTLGLHGILTKKSKDIVMELGLSNADLKKRKNDIAKKIKELYK